jgi:hypothetical protein
MSRGWNGLPNISKVLYKETYFLPNETYYEIKGTITDIKRLNNSVNGNPRFCIVIDGEVLHTKSDAAYCYDIQNLHKRQYKVIAKCYDTKTGSRIEDIRKYS